MIEWRAIPTFPLYEASDQGDVRRITDPSLRSKGRQRAQRRILKANINVGGYRVFGLWRDGKQWTARACRLVLLAFVGLPPTSESQAAHNDGVPTNDSLSNLRWASPKENQADRVKHGTHSRGQRNAMSKLTDAAAHDIRERYARGEKSTYQLAAIHGVSRKTISDIVCDRKWVDIQPWADLPS